MFNLIAFCVLTEMVFGSVNEDANTPIVDGQRVYLEHLPFYAILFHADRRTLLCGSSIVSRKVLLTAAHCIASGNKIIAYVGVSSLDEIKNTKPYKVKKTIIHPHYNSSVPGVYDIGLVFLKTNIKMGPTVRIITLGTSNPQIDEQITVLGFRYRGCIPDTQICYDTEQLWMNTLRVGGYGFENAIKTIGNNSNVCYVDSGGPMIYNNQVIGVASIIDHVGCMSGGTTYTTVIRSWRWIRKYGKTNCS